MASSENDPSAKESHLPNLSINKASVIKLIMQHSAHTAAKTQPIGNLRFLQLLVSNLMHSQDAPQRD